MALFAEGQPEKDGSNIALNNCPERLQRIRHKVHKYDLHVSYLLTKSMHEADALLRAALTEKIVNTDNTEIDIETQVVAVIKYAPITDKK